MNQFTRNKLSAYLEQVATLNHTSSAQQKFSVVPEVQQTLENQMQESTAFLRAINMVGVDEMEGEKVFLGVGSTIASNTDTSGNDERSTSDVSSLQNKRYKLYQNNFDTHIRYASLDAWAKFPDFQTRLRDQIIQAQARDRLRIAFNGTSYAATSNRATNPLLQDVNIGWLQQYRANAADRVMDEVVENSAKVKVYAGGDYENLDALVMDSVNSLIDAWHQDDPDMVVIVGRQLMADKYFPLVNKNQDNSEKIAADLIISQKRMGGLPVVQAPFMPAGTMLITTLDNLSIYYQNGKRRRHIEDNPKKDRIENYESSNDGYVVEDYGRGCLIENIDTTKPAS